MSDSDVQHKLTAILCADVVGYSRLMGDDPEGTLNTLTEYREAFSDKIGENKGRVVNAPGDSILAEFTSVLEAVRCAVDIQRELSERNTGIPDHRRMDFRIGINLGDVMVRDGDIFGDGVNVAARLESLAVPGGICISGIVFQQVKSRLPVGFHDLGEQSVKNIADPVRVYRVLHDGEEVNDLPKPEVFRESSSKGTAGDAFLRALLNGEPLPLPEEPSLAVLAFDNLSSDPEQSFFGDGISEDIITDLSRIPGLVVMARTSSFAYKGKKVDLRQIGRELGVRYVLEGSVRKLGAQVRITAQLIEAESGHHVWAARYDRNAEDLFLVGDEITNAVVIELDVKLGRGEAARVFRKALKNPKSRENFALGINKMMYEFSKEATQKAREYYISVMTEEPNSGWGYGYLAMTYTRDLLNGWSEDPEAAVKTADTLAEKALELDPICAGAIGAKSELSLYRGDFENALQFAEACVKARPT